MHGVAFTVSATTLGGASASVSPPESSFAASLFPPLRFFCPHPDEAAI